MAQPIAFQPLAREDDPRARLMDALDRHGDALISAMELVELLDDRGVLNLLRGLVGAGDRLVGAVTAAVDRPESIQGIRNFILLTKFFASIPPEVLKSLVQAVEAGAEREKECPAPSMWRLLKRMRSENVRHAVSVTLDLLESVGKAI